MPESAFQPAAIACPQCRALIPTMALVCPNCAALTHAEELRGLAAEADRAAAAGDLTAALTAWRQAIDLLPPQSRQHGAVQDRIKALSRELDGLAPGGKSARARAPTPVPKSLARFGVIGTVIWKFWTVLLAVSTKGGLLLAGLTKAGTLLTLTATLGIYWRSWGLIWAAGIIVTTYIHEMGHVFALNRYGLPTTAPMFVPGVGAFVRLKQSPVSAHEDAVIGLAGPIWGCASALFCYAVYLLTGSASWGAIAQAAAVINLFNLLPVWQLDGSRGFRAMSAMFRAIAGSVMVAAGLLMRDDVPLLGKWMALGVGVVGIVRSLWGTAATENDREAFATYVVLSIVLSLIAAIHVPGVQLL